MLGFLPIIAESFPYSMKHLEVVVICCCVNNIKLKGTFPESSSLASIKEAEGTRYEGGYSF